MNQELKNKINHINKVAAELLEIKLDLQLEITEEEKKAIQTTLNILGAEANYLNVRLEDESQ